ncbi:glutamate-rich protein 6-like isoform X7, partial [Biomphalaria glabrata]
VQGREIIQKFYPNGTPFLIIFPDGTGNVLYPLLKLELNNLNCWRITDTRSLGCNWLWNFAISWDGKI